MSVRVCVNRLHMKHYETKGLRERQDEKIKIRHRTVLLRPVTIARFTMFCHAPDILVPSPPPPS